MYNIAANPPQSEHWFWKGFKDLFMTTKGLNKIAKVSLKVYDVAEYIFAKEVLKPIAPLKAPLKSFKELFSATKFIDQLPYWVTPESKDDPLKNRPAWMNPATTTYKVASKVFKLLGSLCKVLKFLDGSLLSLGKIAENYGSVPVLGTVLSYPLKVYRKIFKFVANVLGLIDEQIKAHQARQKIRIAESKIAKWKAREELSVEVFYQNKIERMIGELNVPPSNGDQEALLIHQRNQPQAVHVAAEAIQFDTIFAKVLDSLKENVQEMDQIKASWSKSPILEDLNSTPTLTPHDPPYVELATKQPDYSSDVTRVIDSYVHDLKLLEIIKRVVPQEHPLVSSVPDLVDSALGDSLTDEELIKAAPETFELSASKLVAQGKEFFDFAIRNRSSFLESKTQEVLTQKKNHLDQWSVVADPAEHQARIQQKIEDWSKQLQNSRYALHQTKLNTAHRVMKMAHALFTVICVLTGFTGLPFLLIGVAARLSIRGFKYYKVWWRNKHPALD